MQSRALRLISVFRTIVVMAAAALLTSAAFPAAAQNSQSTVPASAVEAARKPQFASKLAHPTTRPRSQPQPPRPMPGGTVPGGGTTVYNNGPINGSVDAWTINFGYAVTDSFTLDSATTITGFQFGAWAYPNDYPESVEFSIDTTPFGGNPTTAVLSKQFLFTNQFGYDIDQVTATGLNVVLNAGTYWLTLQNAVVDTGNPLYWDENSGPSLAEDNNLGTIPSETFSVQGENYCEPLPAKPPTQAKAVTRPPSPTQTYRVIYNFTGAGDGGNPTTGLVMDASGNLYGATSGGGPSGGGTVFKLTPGASGWRFNRLHSFSGANGSVPDSTLVIGSDGRLYGTTGGGGASNDGVLFGLSPAGSILPSVFSNWMETLLYSFTGQSDGATPGGNLVLDSSGNIYGTAAADGGTNHAGTLYEFTNGGLQVLHTFAGYPNDGASPEGVVNGANGLYGVTAKGGSSNSGVFYTTAGGYQVLHNFAYSQGPLSPTSLTADQSGNLYGAESYSYPLCYAPGGLGTVYGTAVFQLSPPDWNPAYLYDDEIPFVPLASRISTDATGNIFGTIDNSGNDFLGSVFQLSCCWNYTDLHDFAGGTSDGQQPEAAPVVDAHGNIYGTTQYGGVYGQGVVWEISP